MAWTSPRTWTAGETVTAALMNVHLRDNLKAIGDPWTLYTPTLTNWTLGNGTLQGEYMQAGKLVHARVIYIVGSTDVPSGTFQVSLPVAAQGGMSGESSGHASLFDASASARRLYHALHSGTSNFEVWSDGGAAVTSTVPWTWATSDRVAIHAMYEAA